MDAHRFDRFVKALAGRLSRRTALTAGGGGLAAALLGAAARSSGTAQDATPVASPAASPAASPVAAIPDAAQQDLFVQVFAEGTWTPVPGEPGAYTLTLTGHAAQTVWFSDRPDRLVGTVPTPRLLATLGFTPENPPNAALVAQTPDGEEVLVVELFDPAYAEDFGADGGVTVTYRARVLADYAGEGLAALAARQGDAQLPGAFGPASLFIDGCSDRAIRCCTTEHWYENCSTEHGRFGPVGFCYGGWNEPCCAPCSDRRNADWERRCNETFSSCGGKCRAHSTYTFGNDGVECW